MKSGLGGFLSTGGEMHGDRLGKFRVELYAVYNIILLNSYLNFQNFNPKFVTERLKQLIGWGRGGFLKL